MGWILVGFIFAVGIETILRVLSNYGPPEREKVSKTQISLPWYGWSLLGYAALKKKKRR